MGTFKTVDLRLSFKDAIVSTDTFNFAQTPETDGESTAIRRQVLAISEGIHNRFEFSADEIQKMVERAIAKKVNENRSYFSVPIVLDHSDEYLKKVGATFDLVFARGVTTRSGNMVDAVLAGIEIWGDTALQSEVQARVKQDPENTYFSIRVCGELTESELEDAWFGKLINLDLVHLAIVNEPADSNTAILGEMMDQEPTEAKVDNSAKEEEDVNTTTDPATVATNFDLATTNGVHSFYSTLHLLSNSFTSSDSTHPFGFNRDYIPEGSAYTFYGGDHIFTGGQWTYTVRNPSDSKSENPDETTETIEKPDLDLNKTEDHELGMETAELESRIADLEKQVTNLKTENATLTTELGAEKARADKAELAFADFKEKVPLVAGIKAIDEDISDDFLMNMTPGQLKDFKEILDRRIGAGHTGEKGFDQGADAGQTKPQGKTAAELAAAYYNE